MEVMPYEGAKICCSDEAIIAAMSGVDSDDGHARIHRECRTHHHEPHQPTTGSSVSSPKAIRNGLLLYLAFVVYGSLIPFEYRAHTLDGALARFAHIPWLDLGTASRADWVANLVLYVPLALLSCAWLAPNLKSGY